MASIAASVAIFASTTGAHVSINLLLANIADAHIHAKLGADNIAKVMFLLAVDISAGAVCSMPCVIQGFIACDAV